ncbi:MAG: hypothetical protein ACREIC_24420, partial [Limisphaerales bacterium]
MNRTFSLIALATLTLAAPLACQAGDDETGFTPLFNGKDMTGWKLRNPNGHHSWSIEPDGVLKNTVEKGVHGTD